MISRYFKQRVIVNNSPEYSELMERKKINYVQQYSRFDFGKLNFLPQLKLEYFFYEYQEFDKLYMVSQKFYKSPEFGWLILYTNKFRSEFDLIPGTNLKIYFPIEDLLGTI